MKKSLKTKFTLGLLCVSIIPVLILFYLHIKSFYKFYDERTSIIASGEMEKAVYQIDSAFQEVDELVASLIRLVGFVICIDLLINCMLFDRSMDSNKLVLDNY